jgi:hypothetical protein
MKSNALLYVGTCAIWGSALLGIGVGLVYLLLSKVEDFKYGVFYSVFALVGAIGFCLGSIAFYFQFLAGPPYGIQMACSVISLAFAAGFVALAVCVKKDNRALFVVLSFYSLLTIWLAPVFLWNLLYLIFMTRRPRKVLGKSLPATAAAPGA